MPTDNLEFETLPDTEWGTTLNDNLQKVDDAISDSTPSTQAFGDAPDAGNSMEMSRADHEHSMPWLPPNPNNNFINTFFEKMSLGPRTLSSFPSVAADGWLIEGSGNITVSRGSDSLGQGQNTSFLTINPLGAAKTIHLYQRIENFEYLRGKSLTVEIIGAQNESGFTYFADFGDGREEMFTEGLTVHTFTVPEDATELEVGCSFSMSGATNVAVNYGTLLISGNLQNPCPIHPADNALRCVSRLLSGHIIATFLGADNGAAKLMEYAHPITNFVTDEDVDATFPGGGSGGTLDGGSTLSDAATISLSNDNGIRFISVQNGVGIPSRIEFKFAMGELN